MNFLVCKLDLRKAVKNTKEINKGLWVSPDGKCEFKSFWADQGRDRIMRGSNTWALLGSTRTGSSERRSPSQQETFQRQQHGAITLKRNRARDPLGEREPETGLTCPGSVAQHQGGESVGQRALKGNSCLGVFYGHWVCLISGKQMFSVASQSL